MKDLPENLKQPIAQEGEGYTAAHCGDFRNIASFSSAMPKSGQSFPGKLWVKELLGLTGMEFSLGVMPPGGQMPYVHAHRQNEELYVIVSGRGEFSVENTLITLREGSLVRVAPAAGRTLRNTGTEMMVYFVVQAKEGSLEQWTDLDGFLLPEQKPAWETTTA